jgi:PAS domain S-box-containing protein
MGQHQHTVLVVDDEPAVARALGRVLEQASYRVVVAASGGEALSVTRSLVPCMILLDVVMPDFDGYETCRLLKADPRLADVPVAFVTGEIKEESIGPAIASGGVDFITKPVEKAELLLRVGTHIRLHEHMIALRSSEGRFRRLIETMAEGVVVYSPDGHVVMTNHMAEALLGAACAPGRTVDLDWSPRKTMRPDGTRTPDNERLVARAIREERLVRTSEMQVAHGNGSVTWLSASAAPLLRDGELEGVVATFVDITERKRMEDALRQSEQRFRAVFEGAARMEVELRHAQKLEAVGQLAAGIAHEINTPTQFVGDSVSFLKDACDDLLRLVADYDGAVLAPEAAVPEGLRERLRSAAEAAELDYLRKQVPLAFDRTFEGLARISSIVGAMKEFAHPDQRDKTPADLNQALRTTLTIARNEYKYVADVETDLGALPLVECHVGDLNQVFLNLIVNAAHAIADVVGRSGARGRIRVTSAREGAMVVIRIEDTGCGIPKAIQDRIFEPFFTTKEVGQGSGQGLAIARSVVVDKHGGTLDFESEVGRGSTFTIRLPVGTRDGQS